MCKNSLNQVQDKLALPTCAGSRATCSGDWPCIDNLLHWIIVPDLLAIRDYNRPRWKLCSRRREHLGAVFIGCYIPYLGIERSTEGCTLNRDIEDAVQSFRRIEFLRDLRQQLLPLCKYRRWRRRRLRLSLGST